MNKPEIIVGVSKKDLRPPVPVGIEAAYLQLMVECWGQEPDTRPTFSSIMVAIENIRKNGGATEVTNLKRAMSITVTSPMSLTAQFHNPNAQTTAQILTSPPTPLPSWQIDPKDLQFNEELGEGTASTVYKGMYKDQVVAIKILKETVDGKHKDDFEKELQVMR